MCYHQMGISEGLSYLLGGYNDCISHPATTGQILEILLLVCVIVGGIYTLIKRRGD